jgi:hypothetical protein
MPPNPQAKACLYGSHALLLKGRLLAFYGFDGTKSGSLGVSLREMNS